MKTDEEKPVYKTESDEAMEMLGKGYEHRIKDESNDRKYFIITPRIVKAFSRNPYDLALWDTVKDIAGENGECFLNTSQLAALSGMSSGKASDSRKYWIELGFLKGEIRKDPGYPQPVWHITVPDLWQKNIEWCEKHPKINDRIAFMESLHYVKPSPREEGLSPREEGLSPDETKKNYKVKPKSRTNLIDGQKPPVKPAPDNFKKEFQPFANLFIKRSGLSCKTMTDYTFWLYGSKTKPNTYGFKRMLDDGFTVTDMQQAFDYIEAHNRKSSNRSNQIYIKAPCSIYTYMAKMHQQNNGNSAAQEDEEVTTF